MADEIREIREKLLELEEKQLRGEGDTLRVVSFYVDRYRRISNNDDFIIKFVSRYVDRRRDELMETYGRITRKNRQ